MTGFHQPKDLRFVGDEKDENCKRKFPKSEIRAYISTSYIIYLVNMKCVQYVVLRIFKLPMEKP